MPGEASGPSRRALLLSGAAGIVGVLAACSGGSSGSTARSSSASGSGAPAPTTTLGATHVAAADRVTAADATRFSPIIAGTWQGAWRDTTGAQGTTDFTIGLDVHTLTAKATVSANGPLLAGSEVAAADYVVDLLGFARTADSWTLASPQLGAVTVSASGGTTLSGRASTVPDHPEITGIQFQGTRTGRRIDGTYTITKADGSTVAGTMAWSAAGDRAQPADPNATTHDTPADVTSGVYAASLVTAGDLSKAMGATMPAPTANGGRIEAYPAIDTSNARSDSADGALAVQWTVYRGHTPTAISAFLGATLANQPVVPGPWQHGAFLSAGASQFYAYDATHLLEVQALSLTGSVAADAIRAKTLAVATALFPAVVA